jgi:hypothetical protein
VQLSKKIFSRILVIAVFSTLPLNLFAADKANEPPPWGGPHILVTNDDSPTANTATIYQITSKGTLNQKTIIQTGGTGTGGGSYATARVGILHGNHQCVYISDGGTSDIAAIALRTFTVTGNFKGSKTDNGNLNGIGLAQSGHYIYASFTGSNTIGTFKTQSGCKLKFVADITAQGLNGGGVDGMAANGKILVVAYADGSIESFNISNGKPKSNGDAQLSTGYNDGAGAPAGVDISKDSHYAIFGDATLNTSTVEVSDISNGKLTSTIPYTFGVGTNSNNVLLSPDETLLYISDNSSGEVTAAFFNPATGVLDSPCTSSVLNGFNNTWFTTGGLASQLNTGLGGVLYVAEAGQPSSIGIVIPQKGTPGRGDHSCTITELKSSPAKDANSFALESIGVYPPRLF